MNKNFLYSRKGQLSITVVFLMALSVVLLTGFIFAAATFLRISVRAMNRTQAFTVAEAGIEYYKWHLAHAPEDFQDGTGEEGPYVHNYYDKYGVRLGEFELAITPPPEGSSVLTIRSTGRVDADPTIQKIIQVKLAIPSFTRYAAVMNEAVRFGEGTEIFGEIFSNYGIRLDGLAHNIVRSAVSEYDDPDHGGQNEFGVHTHKDPVDPAPPAEVPLRPDVFEAGREFPVPAVDFDGISQDLASIKAAASSSGFYFPSSTQFGYDLVFSSSAVGAFSVYKVTAVTSTPNGCTNTSNEPGWGMWSIGSETLYATGTLSEYAAMFFEDDLWVRGMVASGTRVTVGAARYPENSNTYANISLNKDLLYTNYDGGNAIGLIAQGNINVGLYSNDILRIDGALVAQNGRIGRYYYAPPNDQSNSNKCGPTVNRQRITFYGVLGSNERYQFGFEDITGYEERIIIFDTKLFFEPPPLFPLTSEEYEIISWEEIQ